jgi:drug/metabolite transporter (DMT)-like permease
MKKDISEIYFYALGALIVIGFFTFMIILILKPVPENNESVMNIIVGALIAAFTGVVNYFYGSSKGSKDKTKILSKKVNENSDFDNVDATG